MRSKTLSSEMTILKKDLTRFAPVWLGLCAYLTIWAINLLTTDYYNSLVYEPIAPIFAPILAMVLFSYLFDPKECFMVHSLPIRRERLFGIHILAGLAMFLVPTAIFCFVTRNVTYVSAMYRYLFTAAEFLLLFSIFTLCTMLTGRKIGAAGLYLFILAMPTMLDSIVQDVYLPLLPGLHWNSEFYILNPMMLVSRYADFYHETVLKSRDWLFLGGVLLASLTMLGISLVLYRRRKLEHAGDLLSIRALEPVFAVCAFFFGAVFMTSLESGPNPMVYFGAVIGYLAYWMLSKKTARVFTKKIILGLVVLLVLFTASCIVVESDPLGRVHYLPEPEQIKTASLKPSPGSMERLETTDPEMIDAILKLHGGILNTALDSEETFDDSEFYIIYELTNGQIIVRNYICSDKDLLNRGAFLLSQPEAIFGTADPEMRNIVVQHDFRDGVTLDPALIDELNAVILEECRSGVMFNFNYEFSPWELTIYRADNAEPVDLWVPVTAVKTIAWLEANCTLNN